MDPAVVRGPCIPGHGLTHDESLITARDTLRLTSGRDMILEGAQATGETLLARIGRHLSVTSQQDRNDYQRKDMSAGIDLAVGTGGASVSGHYGQSKINSTWTRVQEQTGVQAGTGGYHIHVNGHTQLTGAAIASTADPDRNHFETASLSWNDLTTPTTAPKASASRAALAATAATSARPSPRPNTARPTAPPTPPLPPAP